MFGPYDDDIDQLIARGRKRGLADAHDEKGPLVYQTASGVYKWRGDNSVLGLDYRGQDAWAEGYVAGYAKGMNSWENPLSVTQYGLIYVGLVGAAAIVYMLTKKPATTGVGGSAPVQIPFDLNNVLNPTSDANNSPITLVLGNSDTDPLPGIAYMRTTAQSFSVNPTGIVTVTSEPGLMGGWRINSIGLGTAIITGDDGTVLQVTVVGA
jgi:hypothetical protein